MMTTKTQLCFLLSLMCLTPLSGWARPNLLNLLKGHKHEYPLGKECTRFIESATHAMFKSDTIKQRIQTLRQLGFRSENFYHYSDDPGDHLLYAVRKSDFSSILSYLFTYANATSNVSGAGLYLSANPFSSSYYGKYQVMLKIDPAARVFDASDTVFIDLVSARIGAKYNDFNYCDLSTSRTLILSENDVDLVFYSPGSEWFVALDEKIITGSQYNSMNTSDNDEIMDTMIKQENQDALIPYVSGIGFSPYIQFSFSNFVNKLQQYSYPKTYSLIELASKSKGPILKALLQQLADTDASPDTYVSADLSQASQEYKDFALKKIQENPQVLKNLPRDLFLSNMTFLIKEHTLTTSDYFVYAKTGEQILDLHEKMNSLKLSAVDQKEMGLLILKSPLLTPKLISQRSLGSKIFAQALNDPSILSQLSNDDLRWVLLQLSHDQTDQNLEGMWSSGLIDVSKARLLLKSLKIMNGTDNLDRLYTDHLDLKLLSDSDKEAVVRDYLTNFNQINFYSVSKALPSLVAYEESKGRPVPVHLFPVLNSDNKVYLLKLYASKDRIDLGISDFAKASLDYTAEVFKNYDNKLIEAIIPLLEASYPRQGLLGYTYTLVNNYTNIHGNSSVKNHMEQFICKKVNRTKAFDELIKALPQEKVKLKALKASYCP